MLPLILLPGMGGDARMFRPQLALFANARVPPWIAPQPGEPLGSYAARMARAVDPGVDCLVAGASFGGMVALEMTRHLPRAKACLLIGSIRSPRELPPRIRILPHRFTRPDVLVHGAGHVLSMTHPEAVNTFLRAEMEKYGFST